MSGNIEEQNVALKPDPNPKPDARPVGQDLSKDIERSIEREPHDRVKCVRVFGDHYRCNWWAPAIGAVKNAGFDWSVATTHHVRKSSFLNATWTSGQLVINPSK